MLRGRSLSWSGSDACISLMPRRGLDDDGVVGDDKTRCWEGGGEFFLRCIVAGRCGWAAGWLRGVFRAFSFAGVELAVFFFVAVPQLS